MKQVRILLADDHRIVAEGIRSLLEPEFGPVDIVEDGRALLAAAEKLRPDVIVADISMPLLNGIDAARQICKRQKDIKIVFLTMHPDPSYAAAAFEAGASGYVLKHAATTELVTAIQFALQGKQYISHLIAGDLMQFYKNSGVQKRNDSSKLTSRQREILQLLAEGMQVKDIAATLNLSSRTVEFHKYRMMAELGIQNSAELVRFAAKHHIVIE
jgi:DNA-binding NarL/FixJ family response regulator